jgi:hypothetical protein
MAVETTATRTEFISCHLTSAAQMGKERPSRRPNTERGRHAGARSAACRIYQMHRRRTQDAGCRMQLVSNDAVHGSGCSSGMGW